MYTDVQLKMKICVGHVANSDFPVFKIYCDRKRNITSLKVIVMFLAWV
jgi:hypothetical protein